MKLGFLLTILCATAFVGRLQADDVTGPDALRPPGVETPDSGSTLTLLGTALVTFTLVRRKIVAA